MDLCAERGVAVQTIKSLARRRWVEVPERRHSWYEPLRDQDSVRAAVHWVLQRPGIFLNSSSDSSLLEATLAAASKPMAPPSDAAMAGLAALNGMEALFAPGVDAI